MRNKIFYLLVSVSLGVVVLGGYRFFAPQKTAERIPTPKKVSLRLKWLDQAQFAGYYLANSRGFYKEEGLAVETNPGGPDISPVQMVVTGVNDFGITGADQLILSREKGLPLVALAVLYKDSPVTILSLKDKGIEKPKDLEGKRVAVVYGRDEEVIYRTLLAKEGVDVRKITEVPSQASPTEVVDKVDARVGYELNCVILLTLMGYEVNAIKPRDYGIKFYGDTLFTTEALVKSNPQLVRSFVRASLKGWAAALADPTVGVEEVMKINSTLDRNHQTQFLSQSVPLVTGKGKIGYSEASVWEGMQETLISQGLLKRRVDLGKVYTNEFLEE